MIRVFRVDGERDAWAAPVAALEGSARYPLGADRFRIDHGRDYFAFFDRLGELAYYVAAEDGEVLAVGCGVIRELPGLGPAWYVGDLKVRPDRRGEHIPLRMLAAAFPAEYPLCRRGYGISMNPPEGENRVLRIFRRFPVIPIHHAATLAFFSLSAAQMRAAAPVVHRHRGSLGYLSLRGVKDLVLDSTAAPLHLLHVQHGPLATPADDEPVEGAVHMLCTPLGDDLCRDMIAVGLPVTATATVIAHRMEGYDWRQVLTSDI
ncbi:MAG: GNAT family N-acetyltransferase [Deltaproteobacteria bacterium]|nr:GNAT family N-acetyltransferase [Deltaproteobacteria bacterium]